MAGTRVLLAADEGTGSLAAVRGLRAGGYEPWVAVDRGDTFAARSRDAAGVVFVPVAKEDPAGFVQRLAAEAARLEVAAVLPGTEATLRALTGREAAFAVPVGTAPPDALERATDKSRLAQLAAEAGFATPPTVEAAPGEEPDVELPAIVKPVASVLAVDGEPMRTGKVVRVETAAELRDALARGGRSLVQPFVTGPLSAICGVAWQGRLVCAAHQVSPRIWPPGRGISSFATTVPRDEEQEARVERLLGLVGWSGVFGLQFVGPPGRRLLIDLNPRIYGSTALAIAAGLNLPAIWADLVLGREPRIGPYRAGVHYRVEEDDLRALALQLRRGDVRGALTGALPRRATTHGVFALRDPLPLAVTLRKAAARLLRQP